MGLSKDLRPSIESLRAKLGTIFVPVSINGNRWAYVKMMISESKLIGADSLRSATIEQVQRPLSLTQQQPND